MLDSFVNLTQAKVILEEETLIEKMPPYNQVINRPVRDFLNWWSMEDPAHCRWFYPWAGGPEFYKKAVWTSHEGQDRNSTPPWSLHQLLTPGSGPVGAPVLNSFDDRDVEL